MMGRKVAMLGNLLSSLLLYVGQIQDVQEKLDEAFQIAQLLQNESSLGDFKSKQGNLDDALDAHQEALKIREALYQAEPIAENAYRVSISCERIGDLKAKQGSAAEASELHSRSAELREQIVTDNRTNAIWVAALAVAFDRMAELSGGIHTSKGRQFYERALELLSALESENRIPTVRAQSQLDYLKRMLHKSEAMRSGISPLWRR